MSTISSAQLEKILELNAKSIEIYVEVNSQYEQILTSIKELKEKQEEHSRTSNEVEDNMVDELNAVLAKIESKITQNQTALVSQNEAISNSLKEIEKQMNKQNWLLYGSGASIILGILGKLLGINIGL